jgi:excisionase family DNA binding protein
MSIPLDLAKIGGPQAALAATQPATSTRPSAPRDDDLPTVMSADEVAALLRVDRKTVYDAVKDGTLPALRLGCVIRFSRSEVLRWFAGPNRRNR